MAGTRKIIDNLDALADIVNIIMMFGGGLGRKPDDKASETLKKAYGFFGKDDEKDLLLRLRKLQESTYEDKQDDDVLLLRIFLQWLFEPPKGASWVDIAEGKVKRNAFTTFLTKNLSEEQTIVELKVILRDLKYNEVNPKKVHEVSELLKDGNGRLRLAAFRRAYKRLQLPPVLCSRVGEWDMKVPWREWVTTHFDITTRELEVNYANGLVLAKEFARSTENFIIRKATERKEHDAQLSRFDRFLNLFLLF